MSEESEGRRGGGEAGGRGAGGGGLLFVLIGVDVLLGIEALAAGVAFVEQLQVSRSGTALRDSSRYRPKRSSTITGSPLPALDLKSSAFTSANTVTSAISLLFSRLKPVSVSALPLRRTDSPPTGNAGALPRPD